MAKIAVEAVALQVRYVLSYKDILNEMKQDVEKLKKLRESPTYEDEAERRDGAVRWRNRVDEILREADQLLSSPTANAVCFSNLKSRHQLGRKASQLTANLHDLLSEVKLDDETKRLRDKFESSEWNKEKFVSALRNPQTNKIGFYMLEGEEDRTILVETVVNIVEDDELFDGVITTRVSETPDLERIQCEIAEQLGFHSKEMTKSERADCLNVGIKKEKSILIIFYDIRGKIDLEKLGIPLGGDCKLLLISRNQRVLQENKTQENFSFRHEFQNIEDYRSSKHESIFDELEGQVRKIFLLCGVYGKSILVRDLLKYVIGLGLLEGINSIDEARNKLQIIIGKLKASFHLRVHFDDREIRMDDRLREIARSSAYQHVYTMERNDTLEDWRQKDFLRGCSQIILNGTYIQELPERLDCPSLELLHLDGTRNGTLKILDSFFEEMTNLQVLYLIGMDIRPELPTSLFSLTKLKTLCLNACSLGCMSRIGELRRLEILSFCNSSMKEFPVEIWQLAHLRMLDLMSSSEIEVIPPNILSELTELEELYMGNLNNLGELLFHDLTINSFQKLRVIKVKSCGRLEHLFLVSKIGKFPQLVEIEVSECSSMKNIMHPDGGTTIYEIKSIPMRSLTLQHLPAINGFCSNDSESLVIPTLFPSDEKVLFCDLKHLKLISISRIMLLVITALSYEKVPLENLETMEIVDCNELQYLFVIKGRNLYEDYGELLPKLSQLRLCKLGKLRSIVGLNHPEGTLSFGMLTRLTVCSCNQLRYVLPLYVLHNLRQLENIVISDCEMLERVFGDDEEDAPMRESNVKAPKSTVLPLPQVKSLIVEELPKFTGCCHDQCFVIWRSLKRVRVVKCPLIEKSSLGVIERPLLKSVEVIECSPWAKNEDIESNIKHLFEFADGLSGLEELKIKDSGDLKKYMEMEIQPSSFSKLRILEAQQCDEELTFFLYVLLPQLHRLEELTVANCEPLEVVFHLPRIFAADEEQKNLKLPNLKTMKLLCLPNLKCIWDKDPRGVIGLGKLVKLEIIKCGLRESPLSTSLLEQLVHLEELKIESCEMIGHVVDDVTEMQQISFRNLKDLQLGMLPKLIKFNSGHCNMTFPNLQRLRIEKCPELNAFTTGFLSKTINEGTSSSYHVPPDEKMDVCPKLQTLKLVGHESFEEIWQARVLNIPECELKEVEVDSFSKLKYIFPSSMLPKLLKLETLVVRNCSSLSDVFQLSENHSIMAFQNLKIVRLKGCGSLRSLLLPCSYPGLTEIDISDCNSLEDIFIVKAIKADEKCFPNLKSIVLENLPMLTSFSLEAFEFPKLQLARIVNCPEIKTFSRNVSAKTNDSMHTDSSKSPPFGKGKTILLPQLQELGLKDLPKMQMWNREPQIPVFQKLISLKIISCGSIKMLFSISVAQHLSSLKLLTLYKCENIVQVLGGGRGNGLQVLFQKLETLVLKHLPRLTSFCEDEDVYFGEFPELKMVSVEDIPKMKAFVKKPLNTPKLKQVYVTYVNKCWRGDLNQTITYLHENQHEKLKDKVWESDQSNTRHHTDTAKSSSQPPGDEKGK